MNQRLESDVAQIEFWWKVSKKINQEYKNTQRKPKQRTNQNLGVHNENKAIFNPNPTVDGQKPIAKQASSDQRGVSR